MFEVGKWYDFIFRIGEHETWERLKTLDSQPPLLKVADAEENERIINSSAPSFWEAKVSLNQQDGLPTFDVDAWLGDKAQSSAE